jgi:drug/metabolite transporter (DMT)-like permease
VASAAIGAPFGALDVTGLTAYQWWLFIAFALFSTVLPFITILKAYQLTTAARASLVGYLVPILAAVASIVVLAEPVTIRFVVAGTLIVVGVWISDRTERRGRIASPI